jgi:hypothetical protein
MFLVKPGCMRSYKQVEMKTGKLGNTAETIAPFS